MPVVVKGKPYIEGVAKGELMVTNDTFSFFGGLDSRSGIITDHKSTLFGQKMSGKVFAYPEGRGSSSTAAVLLEAMKNGVAPAAIITIESEKILVVGAVVAEMFFGWTLPILSIDATSFEKLVTGDYAEIDGSTLVITHKMQR